MDILNFSDPSVDEYLQTIMATLEGSKNTGSRLPFSAEATTSASALALSSNIEALRKSLMSMGLRPKADFAKSLTTVLVLMCDPNG